MTRASLSSRLRPFDSTIFSEMTELCLAHDAVNLGQGAPNYDGPAEVLDAARRAIAAGANQYAPARGVPALRRAIADHQRRWYGLDLDPETEVVVTTGATGAMTSAILGLTEPGDEIVVLDPAYDSYLAAAAMAQVTVRPLPLRAPDLSPDADELRSLVTDRTKLVVVNTPHNPTGRVLRPDELAGLAEVIVEHDLVAVTDEVYEHLTFAPAIHVPLATLPGMAERTVSISSAGKTFSVTGWKVGWATGPADLVGAVAALTLHTTFSNATPFQHAVAEALALPEGVFESIADDLAANRALLIPALERAGMNVLHSEGTYFVTADVSGVTDLDGLSFCRELPERVGVAAIPTQVFCSDPDTADSARSLVRFSLSQRRESIELAGERLQALRSESVD